jgi:4a-hydroxytetrahydrobiopterin dehydratase
MPSIEKLSENQIDAQLEKLKEWSLAGGAIQRTYLFADFVTAIRFVDQVAQRAESAQHHPDMLIRYRKVTLTLATHDAGGITPKDFALAAQCDELAGHMASSDSMAPSKAPAQPAPTGGKSAAPAKAVKRATK